MNEDYLLIQSVLQRQMYANFEQLNKGKYFDGYSLI